MNGLSNMETEVWIDIKGYEGCYLVSNFGRVKSLSREVYNRNDVYTIPDRILTPVGRPYRHIVLQKNGVGKQTRLHRLVAQHFIGEIPKGMEVNHIDEDKFNNHVDNLEIVTPHMNKLHGSRIERCAAGHRKPVKITYPDGSEEVLESRIACCKKLPISKSSITKCLKKGATVLGYRLEYI